MSLLSSVYYVDDVSFRYFLDSLGEEHNTGGAAWISSLLVVVSVWPALLFLSLIVPSCLSVFWDLYCAAPERRETCDHSSEAKAFHDYVSSPAVLLQPNPD